MRRYRFGLTVTTITAEHDEAGEIQAAAADLLTGSPAIESVAAGPMTTEPVAPRSAEPAERSSTPHHSARRRTRHLPRALVRRADRHRHRSLPAADRRTATSHRTAEHRVAVGRDDHDAADRPASRRTLPRTPLPDPGRPVQRRRHLEGSTGWYDYNRNPNSEGEQVLLADPSLAGSAASQHHGEGLVTDRALTPTEWAQVIGRHWAAPGAR
jgi:hypothetical protein